VALVVAAGILVRFAACRALDGILPPQGLYVDERVYAEGFDALSELPFRRPPAMFALSGLLGALSGPAAARWIMAAVSLLPALLLALRMPDRGYWSLAVPLAVALEPDLVLFGLQLLPAVPAAAAVTGALAALSAGRRTWAGLLMGLACLFRAELVLALPLMALLPPRGVRQWLGVALPWAAVLLPVMLLNMGAGAGPVISTNGPENLWLGARRSTLETPPGLEFEQLVAVEGRQQEGFLRRASRAVAARPPQWLLLGLEKAALSLTVPGPGRNLEVGYLTGRLHLRPLLLPMLLLLSLGAWRLIRAGRSGDGALALQRALAAGALLAAFLFLPAARYRLAALPALWMAASRAPPDGRVLPGWAAVAAVLAVLSLTLPDPVRPGLTQIQLAERRLDESLPGPALRALDGARERGYRGADLHNLAGIGLSMTGRQEEALERFREALRLAPRSPTAWKNTAVCLAGMGRWEEASRAAARAVRLNDELEEELAPLLE
jgi:tetratricopeptide (TPR) repeat protein